MEALSAQAHRLAVIFGDRRAMHVVPTICSPGHHQDEQGLQLSFSYKCPVSLAWSPDGEHMVGSTQQGRSVRVRIFSGTGLVEPFVEPFADAEVDEHAVHNFVRIVAGASAIFLVIAVQDNARVVAASAHGCVTARHPPVAVWWLSWFQADNDACLAGVTRAADALYVCSSSQMRATSQMPCSPASNASPLAHSWDRSVSVWAESRTATTRHALLLVDLAAQRLVQSCKDGLPSVFDSGPLSTLGQGACSVTVKPSLSRTTFVLAITGADFGSQRFTVSGSFNANIPCMWHPLGNHSAVLRGVGMSVVDGMTGTPLAAWPDLQVPASGQKEQSHLCGLVDDTGLICQQMQPKEREGRDRSLRAAWVLAFDIAPGQPGLLALTPLLSCGVTGRVATHGQSSSS